MLDIVMCGSQRRTTPPDSPPWRCRHAEHVLGLSIARAGRNRYGDETVAVRQPFLGLLPAGELDENGMTGPQESHWCLFRSRLVAPAGDGLVALVWEGVPVHRSHVRPLAPAEVRLARGGMLRLAELHVRPSVADRLQAAALLLELLALWAAPGGHEDGADAVVRFRTRIEEQADDPTCRLDTLAREVGLHPDWLRRRFIALYGISPVDYRIRLRLTRARDLLQTSALPVAEAARRVGFASPSHFARLFRRHFGHAPGSLARLVPAPPA